MKNILVSFLGRYNSGPLIAIEIAKALKELDYNVYVIISSHISNRDDWYKCNFNKIYELNTYQSIKDVIGKTVQFELLEKKKLAAAFSNVKLDLIIRPMMHKWDNMVSAVFQNVKILTYCHDPLPHSGTFALSNLIHSFWIKKSDYVVVLTKSFIPIVHQKYGIPENRIIYSSHGKLGAYKEQQTIECPDEKLRYVNDKVNFMFFGRIEKYKGLGYLLAAYKEVRKKYENCTLTIIGAGDFSEYEDEAKALPEITVINRYIADGEVGWCFTGKSLVTVLPYTDATQSGVIPIALEYGVPILATNTGGLMEQLYEGEIGVFCEPKNVSDLAKKMEGFLANQDLMDAQKKIMAEKLEDLEWANIIRKLIREIEEIERR